MPATESADLLPAVLFGNAVSMAAAKPELAWNQLLRAEEILRTSPHPGDPTLRVRALCQLSVLAHDRNDFETANAMAKSALASAEKLDPRDPHLLARCLWTLARVERSMGRLAEAR